MRLGKAVAHARAEDEGEGLARSEGVEGDLSAEADHDTRSYRRTDAEASGNAEVGARVESVEENDSEAEAERSRQEGDRHHAAERISRLVEALTGEESSTQLVGSRGSEEAIAERELLIHGRLLPRPDGCPPDELPDRDSQGERDGPARAWRRRVRLGLSPGGYEEEAEEESVFQSSTGHTRSPSLP